MKSRNGFSLIEMSITLSIIASLISFSLPSIYEIKSNKTLNNETNRLLVSFAYARNYAVTHQKQVVICPSLSGANCDNQSRWNLGWMIFDDSNGDRNFNNNDILLQVENPMDDSVTATSSIYRSKIRFNSIGFSPGTNASINFCDKRGTEFAQSLIINNAGRIKQSKPISSDVCT